MTILNIPFIHFLSRYKSATPTKLKIIDAYLTYVFFTGVIQFVYCCLVGTFPFNAFLSGFISCVGCFILGVCLRLQVSIFYYSRIYSLVHSKKIILARECVSTGAAGAQTRRSLGHHLLHPLILRLLIQ